MLKLPLVIKCSSEAKLDVYSRRLPPIVWLKFEISLNWIALAERAEYLLLSGPITSLESWALFKTERWLVHGIISTECHAKQSPCTLVRKTQKLVQFVLNQLINSNQTQKKIVVQCLDAMATAISSTIAQWRHWSACFNEKSRNLFKSETKTTREYKS